MYLVRDNYVGGSKAGVFALFVTPRYCGRTTRPETFTREKDGSMNAATRGTLTGHEAIDYAEEHGLTLHKHTDPTEEARDVTPDEAREIAAEDPSLIWVEAHLFTLEEE